uniref:Uncharacterized protein n=1 Tax=Kalanchoe fedtschenkoi TaxID=63787 RepID=A0A7N0U391_KALFE
MLQSVHICSRNRRPVPVPRRGSGKRAKRATKKDQGILNLHSLLPQPHHLPACVGLGHCPGFGLGLRRATASWFSPYICVDNCTTVYVLDKCM